MVYFGKNVSLGYANSIKDLGKGDVNKGKLYTGDLAYIDIGDSNTGELTEDFGL